MNAENLRDTIARGVSGGNLGYVGKTEDGDYCPFIYGKQKSENTITPAVASSKLTWNGNIPPQKWMNFYTKVLSKFAGGKGLKLTLSVEVAEEGGISTIKEL